jgi:hypothetical protein
MELKEIVMAQLRLTLPKVSKQKWILMFPGSELVSVSRPTFFESLGLANVDPVGMSVDNLVDARFE